MQLHPYRTHIGLRIFTDKLSKSDRHESFPSLAIPFGSHCFLSIRLNTRAQFTLVDLQ